jgi:hypothetical protein
LEPDFGDPLEAEAGTEPDLAPDLGAGRGPDLESDLGPALKSDLGPDFGAVFGADFGVDIGPVFGADFGPDFGPVFNLSPLFFGLGVLERDGTREEAPEPGALSSLEPTARTVVPDFIALAVAILLW